MVALLLLTALCQFAIRLDRTYSYVHVYTVPSCVTYAEYIIYCKQ